jgi:hypothetical protein
VQRNVVGSGAAEKRAGGRRNRFRCYETWLGQGCGAIRDKNPAAVAMGKIGGTAKAKKMTPGLRRKIAQKAAKTRWKTGVVREPTK